MGFKHAMALKPATPLAPALALLALVLALPAFVGPALPPAPRAANSKSARRAVEKSEVAEDGRKTPWVSVSGPCSVPEGHVKFGLCVFGYGCLCPQRDTKDRRKTKRKTMRRRKSKMTKGKKN